MERVVNTSYPNQRQASRTLQLAYPEADAELREELAYLVSARRRTIQDALNYLADKSNIARTNRTARTEPLPQQHQHQHQDQHQHQILSLASNHYSSNNNINNSSNNNRNQSKSLREPVSLPSSSYGRSSLLLSSSSSGPAAAETNKNGNSNLDIIKYTLPSRSISQQSTPNSSFSFPTVNSAKEITQYNNNTNHNNNNNNSNGVVGGNVFRLPRTCTPTSYCNNIVTRNINNNNNNIDNNNNSICNNSMNNSSIYKKYETSTNFANVMPPINISSGENTPNNIYNANSGSNNTSDAKNNHNVMFTNVKPPLPPPPHLHVGQTNKHHLYTHIVNDNNSNYSCSSSDNKLHKYHYFYGDNAEKFDEEIIGSGGQVILYVTSMTGEQRVRDHCRGLETLLYLKEVPYHIVDVADNAILQRRIRLIYERATHSKKAPPMPQLCVDDTLIGDYEEAQELEDNNIFLDKLREAGVKDLRPAIVASTTSTQGKLTNGMKSINASLTNRNNATNDNGVETNNNKEKMESTNATEYKLSSKNRNNNNNNENSNGRITAATMESNHNNQIINDNKEVTIKPNTLLEGSERRTSSEPSQKSSTNNRTMMANTNNANQGKTNKIESENNSFNSNANNKNKNNNNNNNNITNNKNINQTTETKQSLSSLPSLSASSSMLVAPPAGILIKESSFLPSSQPKKLASTNAFLKHAIARANSNSNNNNNNNNNVNTTINTILNNTNNANNNADVNSVNSKPVPREIGKRTNILTRVAPHAPHFSSSSLHSLNTSPSVALTTSANLPNSSLPHIK